MEFTSDWFTKNAEQWPRVLKEFMGRDGVRYLEVGAHEGRSVTWMMEHVLTGEDVSALCLDLWDDHEVKGRFERNVSSFHQIEQQQGKSFPLLSKLIGAEPFDMIYIDGSHEARDVLADAVLAFGVLRVGGVMIFDDYGWNRKQLVDQLPRVAIDAFLSVYADVIDVLDVGYQVAIRRLR